MTRAEHIQRLSTLFNAALEHCPPQTRSVLAEHAAAHLQGLQEPEAAVKKAKP